MSGLPPLREDLSLLAGPERDGVPTWTIHDPARNRYFRISHTAFAMLSRWHLGQWTAVLDSLRQETGLNGVGESDLEWLTKFLDTNDLLQRHDIRPLQEKAAARKLAWHSWLLHNYLFIRIPLLRPDAYLARMLPRVSFLFSRGFFTLAVLAGVIGALLVLRQWDVFLGTFPHFFSMEGMAWLGGALALSKTVHELGHALTAKRLGCRVPTMGFALLVLMPVLYTDTSDGWRLVSRRQRLSIGAAGIIAELMLGAFALLAWSFLPEGPARSAAFSMVTVTLVSTLMLNASPFMRFDGYFLLADALGLENLQDRAFALGRWRLREALFALGEPPPEEFSPRLQKLLLVYCYTTWAYRLTLFLGIALLVYYTTFKLLGILLFIVEIGWFVAQPVWRELKQWWEQRHAVRPRRRRWLAGTTALSLLLLILPVQGRVVMPALVRAADYSILYAPFAAVVESVPAQLGQRVASGDALVILSSPTLDHQIEQVRTRIGVQRALLMREVADEKTRQSISVQRRQLEALEREYEGFLAERARLTIRAPQSGELVELTRSLRLGLWVNETLPLGLVAAREAPEVTAFLAEEDMQRLKVGAAARFVPDNPSLPSWPMAVIEIADVNTAVLDNLYLASVHGGALAVREDRNRRLVPVKGVYQVRLTFAGEAPQFEKATRGTVVADGASQSLLGRAIDIVFAVLVRESGF